MYFLKHLIVCIVCFSLVLNFCSTTPVPQSWPYSQPYSHPSCQDGYNFFNGMCTPINCPATHVIQDGVCVLRRISVTQPAQCTTSCCQANCQPPCQQSCQTQMSIPMQMPMQVQMPMQIPVPMPIPIPIPPLRFPPPFYHIPSATPTPVTPASTTPDSLTPPSTTPASTTGTPTPPPTIQCPNGTISLNGYCHVIYCGIGVYRDGKCIVTTCPESTIWNGERCEFPEEHNHTTIQLSTVIITNNVNNSQVNHDINYTNNLVIEITESPQTSQSNQNQVNFPYEIVVPPPSPPQVHIVNVPSPPVSFIQPPPPPPPPPPPQRPQFVYVPAPQPPPPPSPQFMSPPQVPIMAMPQQPATPNCCTITTPNTCLWEDRYICRSQSYQQCGSVCSQGNLNLKPRVLRQPPVSCINSDCGYNQKPFYPDCSRCTTGNIMIESSYCQTYCQNTGCNSCTTFDLSRYCDKYPDAIACRPEYGYAETSNDIDFYD